MEKNEVPVAGFVLVMVVVQSVQWADTGSLSHLSFPNFFSTMLLWDLSIPNFVDVTLGVCGTELLRGLVNSQLLLTCHFPLPYTGISGRQMWYKV